MDDIRFEDDHLPILQIKTATEDCNEMQRVMRALETRQWDPSLCFYEAVKNQLEIVDGMVLKEELVVIPPKLREKALKIGHSGHLGSSKTKSVLKERVWWPKLSRTVDEWIRACRTCILNGKGHQPVPMQRTVLPTAP